MAKIVETVFVVKISQLIKDKNLDIDQTGFDELPTTLEEVVSGLVSNDCVVEVERA
jgi:hypothetical protein